MRWARWNDMTESVRISAVAYRDGERWLIQGIEHDILARAATREEAPAAFMRAVFEDFCINHHLGKSGLEGIDQAPARFKLMFAHAVRVEGADEAVRALRLECPAHLNFSDMPHLELRIAEPAAA